MDITATNNVPAVNKLNAGADFAELVQLVKKGTAEDLRKLAKLKSEIQKKHAVVENWEKSREAREEAILEAENDSAKKIKAAFSRLEKKKGEVAVLTKTSKELAEQLDERESEIGKQEKKITAALKKVTAREAEVESIISDNKKKTDAAVKRAETAKTNAEATQREYEELIAQLEAALPAKKADKSKK